MTDTWNQGLLRALVAPPDLHGGALLGALVVANWLVLIGPGLLVLLWILGDGQDRRAAVCAALTAFIALGVAHVLSSLFMHPRPFMDGLARNYLNHLPDSSFPSDHATLLFALGCSLLTVRAASAPSVWITPMSLAVAVGWARIYLGAHYPLDVAGALAVALASTVIVASAWGRQVVRGVTDLGERLYAWRPASGRIHAKRVDRL